MTRETLILPPTLVEMLGKKRMALLETAFDVLIGRHAPAYRKPRVADEDAAAERDARAGAMAEMYRSGMTLEQIGARYGLTRERVRQIIRPTGVKKTDRGGVKEAQAARAADREAYREAVDARSRAKYGLAKHDLDSLRDIGRAMREAGRGDYQTPKAAFNTQRRNALVRGIPWELTLAEWWGIWQASGKWDERGRGRYGLLRHGDAGPFAVGNVFVGKWKRGRGPRNWTARRNATVAVVQQEARL